PALAGGTDLMVHLRQPWRGKRPSAVVSLRRVPGLAGIEATDEAIRLGAGVTLSQLIDHPLIQREYPVLPLAARYMGSPAVRNLATVGGNLCNASPAADLPLCAVAPTPRRVADAERALVAGGLDAATVRRAAELAQAEAAPIGDVRATAEYRREMVGVLVRRGLEAIAAGEPVVA